MTVTVTQLGVPTGITTTVQAGGSLAASTTYYYKLVCVETTQTNGRCSYMLVESAPTVEFSATTTGVNKQIKIDWTLPAKVDASRYRHVLVFRTTVSGDYAVAGSHLISGAAGEAYATAINDPITFTDDGTRTMYKGEIFANGIPYVLISGGTTGTPINEEDIYQGYVSAGLAATYCTKTTLPDGTAVGYYFIGFITILAANEFIEIRKGRNVVIFGRWGSQTTTTIRMGSKTLYGGSNPGQGATLGISNCAFDLGNQLTGILQLYGSRVYDLFTNSGETRVGTFWASNASFNGFLGSASATAAEVMNCHLYSFGSNNSYSGNVVFSNCVIEGAPRIEAGGGYTPTLNNVIFYGSQLYSYAGSYVRLYKCTVNAGTGDDILFHGGSTTLLRFIDMIDHTSTNEPLKSSASGVTNPTGTYFLRRYSLSGFIKDSSGTALSGASVRIHNASGYSDTFTDTGATVTPTTITLAATSFAVSSVAALSIGDYIKVEAEVMLITNIVATTLTVTRGQLGTVTNQWDRVVKPIYKLVNSVTTDANGDFEDQYYLSKMLQGKATGTPYNYDTTVYGPHVTCIRKYGYKTVRTSGTVSAPVVLSTLMQTDTVITTTNSATVAAYTGISINHGTQTITLTANHSVQELYDYCQYNLTVGANMAYADFFTSSNGQSFTSSYNLTLNGGNITGSGSIDLGAKTFTRTGSETSTLPITYNSGASVFTSVSVSGFVSGSRVYVRNITDSTDVYNAVVAGTSVSIPVTWTANKSLRVRVAYVSGATAYLPVEQFANLTTSGASILVTQQSDDVYNANAIDGSTVTEFTADYPNVQVDVSDPDNTTTVQRLYAWFANTCMSSTGIASFLGGVVAEDVINYRIVTSILGLKLDNTAATPVIIAGARLYRDDDATVIASTSGSIQMDPEKAYMADTGTLGAAVWGTVVDGTYTAEESLRLINSVQAGKTIISGSTVKFRNPDDTKDVIVATMTGRERTSLTYNVT